MSETALLAISQPCPPDDRRPPPPFQNMLELDPPILLLALLTTAMPFGVQVMPASTCCSLGCVVPQGPWKSFATFGRKGVSYYSAYHSSHPTPSPSFEGCHRGRIRETSCKAHKGHLGKGRDRVCVLSSSLLLSTSPPDAAQHVKRVSKLARHTSTGDRQAVLLPSTTRPADPQRARKPRCRVRRPSGPTSQRLSGCDRETIQNKTGTGRPRQQGSGEIRAGLPPH